MQKFREDNQDTVYEDVLMPPGFTHDPFFTVGEDRISPLEIRDAPALRYRKR